MLFKLGDGMEYKKIAQLLFPDIKLSENDIYKKYPKRNLEDGQIVTRFAPSPTGFMHIGNFFQAFISYNLAIRNGNTCGHSPRTTIIRIIKSSSINCQ